MKKQQEYYKNLRNGGIVATLLIALCCLTPILVVLFITGGLAAYTGYLDYILFPLLAAAILVVLYAHYKCKTCKVDNNNYPCCELPQNKTKEVKRK